MNTLLQIYGVICISEVKYCLGQDGGRLKLTTTFHPLSHVDHVLEIFLYFGTDE